MLTRGVSMAPGIRHERYRNGSILDFRGIQDFRLGGTGLLIVVGVALDIVQKVESHLLMRHYDGFMKGGRIRGRRGF